MFLNHYKSLLLEIAGDPTKIPTPFRARNGLGMVTERLTTVSPEPARMGRSNRGQFLFRIVGNQSKHRHESIGGHN